MKNGSIKFAFTKSVQIKEESCAYGQVFRVKNQLKQAFFDENMNGQTYCDVSNHELKQSIAKLPDKGKIIYQQALAPWHTSKMVKAKMKKTKLKVFD